MKARALQFLDDLHSSYWFIPSLMAVGAIVLSIITVTLDERIESDWPESIPFMYSNKPDGARALLATVAGSMITVAGVTFSLTLLAVSHTTSQFGPRLLTNFMRDRGNQVTLGTFIATFLYCLLVLRAVRTAEEASAEDAAANLIGAFVPHISIAVSIILTLCSVGVLIFFFHHVPESMNLSNVVAGVGRNLARTSDQIFPEMFGHDAPEDVESPEDEVPDDDRAATVTLGDKREGFIQTMDEDGLLDIARKKDLIFRLRCRPGDFLSRYEPIVDVWPAEKVDDDLVASLRGCLVLGEARTPHQNLLFQVDQLVEIASRALSPGVNDPYTAIICMNWLGNALSVVGHRRDPKSHRYDEDKRLRVIAPPITFARMAEAIFDQLRPYFAADRNAALQMMKTIHQVRRTLNSPSRQQLLTSHAIKLHAAAKHANLAPDDLALLSLSAGEELQYATNPGSD